MIINLTDEQLEEMFNRFPQLYGYIVDCEIKNEIRYLEDNEYSLDDWQKRRLEFLRFVVQADQDQ